MRVRFPIVMALTTLLAACGMAVPADKAAYVGEWQSTHMALSITQDGRVEYRRAENGMTKSVSAPLKGFDGNNFSVGLGPVSTTFIVSVPPHRDGDATKMTVDGVELTRSR